MNEAYNGVVEWLTTGRWIDGAVRLSAAAGVILAAFLLARLVGKGLRRLGERSRAGRPMFYIVEKLAGYGLVLAGVLVGLSTLGIDLTSLAVFAGAVGVGVGLGLQGIVREFVSGLVSIFDPLVNVGDFIELENGVRGEVAEVGPRATRVRTNDGVNVVIPNSKLIETQVTNWTLKGGTRRIHIPFSVAYGVDKSLVRDVVLEGARKVPFSQPDTENRKSQVWLTGFGDSALNFELVVWPAPEAVKRPSAMNAAYTWAIEDALRGASIEIPYPQLDLRVRSLFGQEGEEARRAAHLEPAPRAQPVPQSRRESRNDAAEALISDAEEEAREKAAEEAA